MHFHRFFRRPMLVAGFLQCSRRPGPEASPRCFHRDDGQSPPPPFPFHPHAAGQFCIHHPFHVSVQMGSPAAPFLQPVRACMKRIRPAPSFQTETPLSCRKPDFPPPDHPFRTQQKLQYIEQKSRHAFPSRVEFDTVIRGGNGTRQHHNDGIQRNQPGQNGKHVAEHEKDKHIDEPEDNPAGSGPRAGYPRYGK